MEVLITREALLLEVLRSFFGLPSAKRLKSEMASYYKLPLPNTQMDGIHGLKRNTNVFNLFI